MQRFAIGLAALALVVSFHVDAGAHNVPYTSPKMLAVAGATTSIPQISGGSVCSASVSGRWAGTLAFQVSSPGALPESAEAQSDHGNNVGRTTSRDGIFVWRASEGQTCHVTMTSDRGGIAAVALAASNGVASSGETPLDPPSVTWYNTTSPWPSPITSAYVGIGEPWARVAFTTQQPTDSQLPVRGRSEPVNALFFALAPLGRRRPTSSFSVTT